MASDSVGSSRVTRCNSAKATFLHAPRPAGYRGHPLLARRIQARRIECVVAQVLQGASQGRLFQPVEPTLVQRDQPCHLAGHRARREAPLAEQRPQQLAAPHARLQGLIEPRAEAGEQLQLQELQVVEPQPLALASNRRVLGLAADARNRGAHVDRGEHPASRELAAQVDLAVRDGDQVGGNVGRHFAELRGHDRQRGHAAAAVRRTELRAALEQARMQVEDVAWIGLAARRAAQQQREFAVCLGMFGEVVVDDQRVVARAHPALGERTPGEWREVLQAGERASLGDHDGGMRHGAMRFEQGDRLRRFGAALADQHQHAANALVLLVDDRVQRQRALAGALVSNQQLALAAADRQQCVDQRAARVQGGGSLHRAR
jgi:hypothetical protein